MISVLVVYKVASLNCYFSHFSMISSFRLVVEKGLQYFSPQKSV